MTLAYATPTYHSVIESHGRHVEKKSLTNYDGNYGDYIKLTNWISTSMCLSYD